MVTDRSGSPAATGKARARRARHARRASERGSTIFTVLTVLLILSSIGIFAMSNASYEVTSAGYLRRHVASSDVAGMGALATTTELGAAPTAYIGRMRQAPTTKETCVSLSGLGLGSYYPPCFHIYLFDVQNRAATTVFSLPTLPAAPAVGSPGSFGLTQINGGFWSELTDPIEVVRPVAGAPIDGSPGTPKFIDVTTTAYGVVFVDLNLNGIVDSNEFGSASYSGGRGHVIVGPIYGSM